MRDIRQECVYSNGIWMAIKRTTEYGIFYGVVRYGSAFFENTFRNVSDAIRFCDMKG